MKGGSSSWTQLPQLPYPPTPLQPLILTSDFKPRTCTSFHPKPSAFVQPPPPPPLCPSSPPPPPPLCILFANLVCRCLKMFLENTSKEYESLNIKLLIAALISAGYYCARIFFLLRQTFFRFTILPLFRHFA